MSIGRPTPQNFRDALEVALRKGPTLAGRREIRAKVLLGLCEIGIRADKALYLTSRWLDDIEGTIETEKIQVRDLADYRHRLAMDVSATISAEEIIRHIRNNSRS